ncbi:ankyrin repeat-containing domain protein [Xylaria curta]|nr:ankyrin repeat-containing domain protein [Xylaria curta]
MEVVGAVASFIAIGQAVGATPKIIKALRSFTNANRELEALIDELERLCVFYEHLKENIDLFSGEHGPAILRVKEPPYLKLVRKDIESLMVELQELVDSCLIEATSSLKASKLRWWKKRRDLARLRDECNKQRQQLQHFYMLFRDRHVYKQGQLLFQVHASVPQETEHTPHRPNCSPSLNGNDLAVPQDTIQNEIISRQSKMASQGPIPATERIIGRRCCCPCHSLNNIPRQRNYSLQIPLSRIGFLSYRFQQVMDNRCKINCCTATQSFVALQFRIPIWLRRLDVAGTFKFGFPLNLYMSITPIKRYSSHLGSYLFDRVCYLAKPDYLNRWLSYYAGSIVSVDESGKSVLENIVIRGGSPLLTYCATTWPGLIKGTDMGRSAAYNARMELIRGHYEKGCQPYLSSSDKFHFSRFIEFMEIEDDNYNVINILCSENPIKKLAQVSSETPDMLTARSMGGHTILDYACLADNAELVQYILDLGIPFNLSDVEGSTSLHMAIRYGAWRSARLLVSQGHPVNVCDTNSLTPLLFTIKQITKHGIEAIRFAKTLLLQGADASILPIRDESVWHWIAATKYHRADVWELCGMLYEAGGARLVNLTNDAGLTPLVMAVIGHHVPLISFLQKVGVDINAVNNWGWNLLHWIAETGDSHSCQLMDKLEISCIDIRTTNNRGFTPLRWLRWQTYVDHMTSDDMGDTKLLSWYNIYHDKPGKDQFSQEKAVAFEHLLRGIRDRMLNQEIKELEAIISNIHARHLMLAREKLRRLAEGKVKAKIDHEAETFRAIELDVRMDRLELAVESIKEFIEASRDRMLVSLFDEEENPWETPESSVVSSEVDQESTNETDDEGSDWRSSEELDGYDGLENEELKGREDDDSEDSEEN